MSTADELRAGIDGARAAMQAAIAISADNWEVAMGDGEGEEHWSPRQVAEHAIPAEIMLASHICAACGYDGPENPLTSAEFATADEALAAFAAVNQAVNSKVRHVQDDELGQVSPGGDGLEPMTVAELMAGSIWHLSDHAAQLTSPL